MIIVCKNCKASFLVPASLFSGGARTVRCAKCKQVWKETPLVKGAQPHPPKPVSNVFTMPAITPEQPDPIPEPTPLEESSTPQPIGNIVKVRLKHLTLVALCIAAGFLLFSTIVFIAGHSFIIKRWPDLQHLYIELHLAKDPLKDNILIQNIVSERHYRDGAMQLVVTGEIHSDAKKRQVVPAISVEAMGPDGRLIESWRIAPPQGTIDSGATVPFSSSIVSPEGTVVEVNLSFVEPPHDEH